MVAGVVRTNSPVTYGNGGGSGGGTGTVDLPTHLNSISANSGNGFIELTLGYSNTDYVDKVWAVAKTGGYPENPTDGKIAVAEGAATTVRIGELENGLTYYIRVFLVRVVDGVEYFQTDVTNAFASGMPIAIWLSDTIPVVASGKDFIVVDATSEGYITAPAGTQIVLASAGGKSASNSIAGGASGYVAKHILDDTINNQPINIVVGTVRTTTATIVTIGEASYNCGSQEEVIITPFGPIGGAGGNGGKHSGSVESYGNHTAPTKGTGAGGGGGAITMNGYTTGGEGGNWVNRTNQNFGGAGGNMNEDGTEGRSGAGGSKGTYKLVTSSNVFGGGGGGGYGAGGGSGGGHRTSNGIEHKAGDGQPGFGVVVFIVPQ
ncbi:MAG: hypothetical protein J1F09_01730 [Oscillospiraceae bacterium]|nr:hypothetical protein [Oscillospiraceae bacterium]